MGISWSNHNSTIRRRNNAYYQNPSPPLPYYSSEPIPLTSPPPPPQSNYLSSSSSSSSSTTNTTPPPQNPYCTPPPPPPPLPAPFQPYHHYNSSGYTPQLMGRFNYPQQPYFYANQGNGWWHIRPGVVGPTFPQPVEPAPYVEHQNAKKIRNDVNVHKDTLKVEVDEDYPDHHLVSFVFDALLDGSITILYFAKEESNCRFVPLFPEAHLPVTIPFQKGLGQKFCQPSGTGIDLGFFELDDLAKPSPEEEVFPLVIVAETFSSENETPKDFDSSVSNTSNHMQITQAVLEKKADDSFMVKVIKQILWVDGVRYELREIYGMGSSSAEGFDDSDPGKECVICMTEPKDTAILPCRHMCLCGECAKALRLQSNKCPICRQPIEKLIEIKINSDDK